MKKLIVFGLLGLSIFCLSHSYPSDCCQGKETQIQAWVFFTDKAGTDFDPYAYFDQKAIERRLRHGLCLYDSLDYPVSPIYLDILAAYVDTVSVVSRWLNGAIVMACHEKLHALSSLSFVGGVELLHMSSLLAGHVNESPSGERMRGRSVDRERVKAQSRHLEGHIFLEHGFDGRGVRIAVFDAGFPGVDTHPVFSHLLEEGRIIDTWDFHRGRADVYRFNQHGTNVLSMIAGQLDDLPMGLASGAEYLLARTEIRREPLFEEIYWLAAAEWADRHGADIINSSLGYYHHRYFPEDMNGSTSIVARAAGIAASKGMLIVNAAGNEGNSRHWRIIITPADADSVLTVGAVEYPSLLRTSYTSLGPTADKRMKPNVVAMGDVVVASPRGFREVSGTSFASPLVAGFAACLWQMFPDWTNMEVFNAIQNAANLYPYYDYAHGYGVPQAGYFFSAPSPAVPTFDIVEENSRLSVIIRQDPSASPGKFSRDNYLFYQVKDSKGLIMNYHVVKVERPRVLSFDMSTFEPGQQLFLFYDGYVTSRSF